MHAAPAPPLFQIGWSSDEPEPIPKTVWAYVSDGLRRVAPKDEDKVVIHIGFSSPGVSLDFIRALAHEARDCWARVLISNGVPGRRVYVTAEVG